MATNFSKLHTIHLEQLINYLEFEKKNRKNILNEVKDEIEDHMDSRIDQTESYSGNELIDALEDTPDVLENVLDRALEHQRDITTVLIQRFFKDFQEANQEVSIGVARLENELDVKQAHQLSESLIKEPQAVLKAAPLPPDGAKVTKKKEAIVEDNSGDEGAMLEAENEKLRKQIEEELAKFPQYQKLLQMTREREIELSGLKARL